MVFRNKTFELSLKINSRTKQVLNIVCRRQIQIKVFFIESIKINNFSNDKINQAFKIFYKCRLETTLSKMLMDVRLKEMCKILRIAIFHSKSDQDGFARKILHLYSKRLMCHAKVF